MSSKWLTDTDRRDDFLIKFLLDKKYRIIRHSAILLFLFLVITNLRVKREFEGAYEFSSLMMSYIGIVILFYINMYFLIPRILYNRKYFYYLACLTALITVTFLITDLLNRQFIYPHRISPSAIEMSYLRRLLVVNILSITFILSSTALKLFQRWNTDTVLMNELEKHALHIELQALKNQINPHFLFNMLNNVNVLIKKDPVKASLIMIKLSDFLRYTIYENNKTKVLLQADIKFLTDFLNLEKIRRDDFDFTIENEINAPCTLQLPPNIFTTFVENAIKHSMDTRDPSYVKLKFNIVGCFLSFTCSNSKPLKTGRDSAHKGLGLTNIKRTLHILYGDSFNLDTLDDTNCFRVNLKLPL